MSQTEKGIAHLGVIVAVVAVAAAVIFGGWYVWSKDKEEAQTDRHTTSSSQPSQKSQQETKSQNMLALANNSVAFLLPDTWTNKKGSDFCIGSVTAEVSCLEGAVITPGAQLPTRYGDGTEFFNIKVSVFDNAKRSDAKKWLEVDFDEGPSDPDEITSTTAINGYNTYYLKNTFGGDGTEVEEIYYVFSVDDKVVLVYARIYEPGVRDGTQVGDFRQFESAITEMAKTVEIQ